MPSPVEMSTGRRIERFSISIRTMSPMPLRRRRRRGRRRRSACRRGCRRLRRQRRLLDQAEALALGHAPRSARRPGPGRGSRSAASYCACRRGDVALQPGRSPSRSSASPGSRPRARRALASSVAFSSAMYFSRSSIGASSTSSSESGAAGVAVGVGHRPGGALLVDERPRARAIWVCSTRTCGLDAL